MASGDLGLSAIRWLAWIQPAVVPVGWLIIILTAISAVITIWEFVTK